MPSMRYGIHTKSYGLPQASSDDQARAFVRMRKAGLPSLSNLCFEKRRAFGLSGDSKCRTLAEGATKRPELQMNQEAVAPTMVVRLCPRASHTLSKFLTAKTIMDMAGGPSFRDVSKGWGS